MTRLLWSNQESGSSQKDDKHGLILLLQSCAVRSTCPHGVDQLRSPSRVTAECRTWKHGKSRCSRVVDSCGDTAFKETAGGQGQLRPCARLTHGFVCSVDGWARDVVIMQWLILYWNGKENTGWTGWKVTWWLDKVQKTRVDVEHYRSGNIFLFVEYDLKQITHSGIVLPPLFFFFFLSLCSLS